MTLGFFVPLYWYPGEEWDGLEAIKQNFPSVQFTVVINPANGIGTGTDTLYREGVKALQAAGISVLGYVFTNYANRLPRICKHQASVYKSWYGVDGIFFDQVSPKLSRLGYYEKLANFVKNTLGLKTVVGNPGIMVDPAIVFVFDYTVVFEDTGLAPPLSGSRYISISYGVPTCPPANFFSSQQVNSLYVTDLTEPDPYSRLPSYLSQLLSSL